MKKMFLVSVTVFVSLLIIISSLTFAQAQTLMMATTTSTDNTGLLDKLAPIFENDTGIELKWVAVGTGKALKMGKNCDVDLLLVHAPASEKRYVADGYGVNRRQVMYNDFVIIGPPEDRAKIRGMTVNQAMRAIAKTGAVFVSRGDNSGTNKKEISLWAKAGLGAPDKQNWYVQTGQGMIKSILIAEERDGYTLTDRGTYIKYRANKATFEVLVEGDKCLANQYSVIIVNPKRCESVKYDTAGRFSDWIVSPKIQGIIGNFRLLGKPLFTPNAKR